MWTSPRECRVKLPVFLAQASDCRGKRKCCVDLYSNGSAADSQDYFSQVMV